MRALLPVALLGLAACGPSDPCRSPAMRRQARYARPYAGHWRVARGDTLTLPQMGDRFRLTDVELDTASLAVGRTCRYTGRLVFQVPRETLAVTWLAQPDQALVFGWPAELGPFGGIGVARAGDSLAGAVLFDERLGVRVPPGVTARFVAGRAP